MTHQELEQLITFVLDLSNSLNKKITRHDIDFNTQIFCNKSPDMFPIFKRILYIIEQEEIDEELWNYGCKYLENNYNLKLTAPDIVLDEILITAKTLLGLSAANFRKIENETE